MYQSTWHWQELKHWARIHYHPSSSSCMLLESILLKPYDSAFFMCTSKKGLSRQTKSWRVFIENHTITNFCTCNKNVFQLKQKTTCDRHTEYNLHLQSYILIDPVLQKWKGSSNWQHMARSWLDWNILSPILSFQLLFILFDKIVHESWIHQRRTLQLYNCQRN